MKKFANNYNIFTIYNQNLYNRTLITGLKYTHIRVIMKNQVNIPSKYYVFALVLNPIVELLSYKIG